MVIVAAEQQRDARRESGRESWPRNSGRSGSFGLSGLSPGQLLGRPIRIRAHLDGAIFGDTTTAGEAYAPDSVNQAMPFVEQQSGGAKMEAAVEAGGEER
jgi:hypothetical protein